jgi:hypothetical protein
MFSPSLCEYASFCTVYVTILKSSSQGAAFTGFFPSFICPVTELSSVVSDEVFMKPVLIED